MTGSAEPWEWFSMLPPTFFYIVLHAHKIVTLLNPSKQALHGNSITKLLPLKEIEPTSSVVHM
jgi:hypothetical protein